MPYRLTSLRNKIWAKMQNDINDNNSDANDDVSVSNENENYPFKYLPIVMQGTDDNLLENMLKKLTSICIKKNWLIII